MDTFYLYWAFCSDQPNIKMSSIMRESVRSVGVTLKVLLLTAIRVQPESLTTGTRVSSPVIGMSSHR